MVNAWIAAAVMGVAAPLAAQDAADRAAIGALIAAEDAAWEKGDADAFGARTLPDVAFTNIVGMHTIGRVPFVAQHRRILSTIYKGSRVSQRVTEIQFPAPGVAIVHSLTRLTGYAEAPPGAQPIGGALRTRLQQVLVKKPDGWWVASFHNVVIQPGFLPKDADAAR